MDTTELTDEVGISDIDGVTNSETEPITDTDTQDTVGETDGKDDEGDELTDYEAVAREDLAELKRHFPELRGIKDITEIRNPTRYAALRDLGLSAEEAYLATNSQRKRYDNRAHLTPSVPSGAALSREMSHSDYDMARELFSDLTDSEIRKLYRKVTK